MAIPAISVPLGRYARAWLSEQGLLGNLEGRIIVTEHARATLAAVDAGHAELAVIYRSELRLAKRAKTIQLIEASEHRPIRYVVARASHARECTSIDDALHAWRRPALQQALARADFIPIDGFQEPR